jgi:chromosome segregation ATPase
MTDKRRREADSGAIQDLKRSIAELDARLVAQQAASTAKFGQVEAQLQEHAAKLAEMPSTKQIVDAMEQLLSRTMSSLDERLTTQAHSIEVLKTTVSQTDSLLERVLESLDSLQSYGEAPELVETTLTKRPAV